MEFLANLSEILQPYKDLVAKIAGIFTLVQLLSPLLVLWQIIKKKTTKNESIIPFMGGFVL